LLLEKHDKIGVMNINKVFALVGLIVVVVMLAGCAPPPTVETNNEASLPERIECQVYYRGEPGEQLDGKTITLDKGGPGGGAKWDELIFNAVYSGDQYEGWTVVVSVSKPANGEQVARQLYQIDRAKGLRNQFVGGHGFTGLVYLYPLDSQAEMQYFCTVLG